MIYKNHSVIYVNQIMIYENQIVILSFFLREKMFFVKKKKKSCEEIRKMLLRVVTLQSIRKGSTHTMCLPFYGISEGMG